jgi:FkbM family methyltransferase
VRSGVSLVLDVGASAGEFGRTLRAEGYAGRIVSLEPLPSAFAELERRASHDAAWECRRIAVGGRDGRGELHVSANAVSSSLLPVGGDHVRAAPGARRVRSESVALARLDTLAAELVRPGERPFLKLDVQGAELEALRGGERLLDRLAGVECELSLTELYVGQPLLADVAGWLRERAFVLVSLAPALTDPSSGELLQVDGLFARRPSGTAPRKPP